MIKVTGGPHMCFRQRLEKRSIISFEKFYETKFLNHVRPGNNDNVIETLYDKI